MSWKKMGGIDYSQYSNNIHSNLSNFNTIEKTGGASTHTLSVAELPAHTHSYDRQNTSTDNISIHDITRTTGGNSSATSGSTGSGSAHNNLQPYITVYMWKRTA